MDLRKEDVKIVGVREEDEEDAEADDSLWKPLKGTVERKGFPLPLEICKI